MTRETEDVRRETSALLKAHQRLDVWQRAMDLVTEVYRLSGSFPERENYGLTSQMRRAAVSIPSNIAEGAARETGGEFLRFLYIARGSLAELETQLLLAVRLGYVQRDEALLGRTERVFELISGTIRHVKNRQQKRRTSGADHVSEDLDVSPWGIDQPDGAPTSDD